MDPNANLKEQLELAQAIQQCTCNGNADCDDCSHAGQRLAELVVALHGWISKGGFLPVVWVR